MNPFPLCLCNCPFFCLFSKSRNKAPSPPGGVSLNPEKKGKKKKPTPRGVNTNKKNFFFSGGGGFFFLKKGFLWPFLKTFFPTPQTQTEAAKAALPKTFSF